LMKEGPSQNKKYKSKSYQIGLKWT